MITKAELKQKIGEALNVPDYSWQCCNVQIGIERDGADIKLTLSQMYEYLDEGNLWSEAGEDQSMFARLQRLAKLFKTEKINVGERDFRSGCITCDHGSEYTAVYWIKGSPLEIDMRDDPPKPEQPPGVYVDIVSPTIVVTPPSKRASRKRGRVAG